jgi:hypothetical protein
MKGIIMENITAADLIAHSLAIHTAIGIAACVVSFALICIATFVESAVKSLSAASANSSSTGAFSAAAAR